jgi:hypothetical protein
MSKSAFLRKNAKNPKFIGSLLLFPFLPSTPNHQPSTINCFNHRRPHSPPHTVICQDSEISNLNFAIQPRRARHPDNPNGIASLSPGLEPPRRLPWVTRPKIFPPPSIRWKGARGDGSCPSASPIRPPHPRAPRPAPPPGFDIGCRLCLLGAGTACAVC